MAVGARVSSPAVAGSRRVAVGMRSRVPGSKHRPVRTARERRQRFPGYFEMDSAALFMAGVTLLALVCLLYLLQTSRVAVLGYQIQQVQLQQTQAVREADNLRYEISRRESLPEVERYARQKLRMRPVKRYQYLRVRVSSEDLREFRSAEMEVR